MLKLTPPPRSKGYASNDEGLGLAFHLAAKRAYDEYLTGQLITKGDTPTDLNYAKVKEINNRMDRIRFAIDLELMSYLRTHDGVVDAWPNPKTDLHVTLSSGLNPPQGRYIFDFFGGDYTYNGISVLQKPGPVLRKPSQGSAFSRLVYDADNEYDAAKKEVNKFSRWKGFIGIIQFLIIMLFPLLGCIGALYLLALTFSVADQGFGLFLFEALGSGAKLISLPSDMSPFIAVMIENLVTIVAYICAIPIILLFICDFIYSIASGSTVVLCVIAVALFLAGIIVALMLKGNMGEDAGLRAYKRGRQARERYRKAKQVLASKEYKDAKKQTEKERQEDQAFIDSFYEQWFNYVRKHR